MAVGSAFTSWTQSWFSWLKMKIGCIEQQECDHEDRIKTLERKLTAMSAEFDALKSAWESYKDDVSTKVAALSAAVTALTAQVAADSTDSESIKSLTAEVTAAQTALDSAANPPSAS